MAHITSTDATDYVIINTNCMFGAIYGVPVKWNVEVLTRKKQQQQWVLEITDPREYSCSMEIILD